MVQNLVFFVDRLAATKIRTTKISNVAPCALANACYSTKKLMVGVVSL